MNSELFVPISVLSGMNKMKALTTDVDLIMAALKQSQQLVVDEAQRLVRPNFKLQRNTLILRDIPSDTPLEVL
jgi:la-related protein 4